MKRCLMLSFCLRLVLLAFLFAPLLSMGATCPGCKDLFLSVSSQLTTLQTDVGSAYNLLNDTHNNIAHAENRLASVSGSVSLITDQSLRIDIETDLSKAKLDLSKARGTNEKALGSLSSVSVRLTSLKDQVDSFDCTCSTNFSGSCACPPYLVSIQSVLEMLRADVQEISEEVHSIYYAVYNFYTSFQELDRILRARLNTVDDSYMTELENLALDFKSVCESVLPDQPDYEPLNLRLAGLSSFDLSNEGATLFSIDGHLDYNNALQLDATKSLRYIASNLTSSAGLEWVTNYLNDVQASFFREFNFTYLARDSRPQYFPLRVGNITSITNFFNNPTPIQNVTGRYLTYRKAVTNWFDRIEVALLNLNGVFATKSLSDEAEASMSSETSFNEKLTQITNSYSEVSKVWSSTNTVSEFITRFNSTVSRFTLPDSSSSQEGFMICPEFVVAGITFGPLVLPFSDLSGVVDFCRSLFRVLWYAIFAVVSFRMLFHLVVLLGKAVGQVIAIVKALL